MRVILCDAGCIGAGASGGFLGALMCHMPERWNAKKQFQLDALVSLEERICDLEAETGLSTGYGRVGRILPLNSAEQRALAETRKTDAARNWRVAGRTFDWQIVELGSLANWPGTRAVAHGAVVETLSGRVDPRALLAALGAGAIARGVTLIEERGLKSVDGEVGLLSDGAEVHAGAIALTAGIATPALLQSIMAVPETLGRPVKGQAALLAADLPAGRPLVFRDGVYVVPHANGTVAVGSTSENAFADPCSTDGQLDTIIDQAGRLCPELAGACVIERWAALRPRAVLPDPMIGRIPGRARTIVATGGFKITLGIAHEMARAVLLILDGDEDAGLPETFRLQTHLARAGLKQT